MVGERQVPGAVHRPAGRPDPPAGEGSATGRRRPLRGDGAGQSSLTWGQLPAAGPPTTRERRDKVRQWQGSRWVAKLLGDGWLSWGS
jgi:hypothetical protein